MIPITVLLVALALSGPGPAPTLAGQRVGSDTAFLPAGDLRVRAVSPHLRNGSTTGGPASGTSTTGTPLLTEGFDDASVSARGWYDNTSPVVTTEEQHAGAGALQMGWMVGGKTPVHGGSLRHAFSATDRLYVRYWVKYSANWVGSGVGYHPHEINIVTSLDPAFIGPSATHMTAYVEHNYQHGGVPRLSLQDALNIDADHVHQDLTHLTEARAVAGCNGSTDGYATQCYQSGTSWRNGKEWTASQPAFLPTPGQGYKNDWHQVEAYFQLNTIGAGKGAADGIVQYWFDGRLLIDHQNVLFRTATHPTMMFNQFLIAPYIGVGSPVAQTMWVDDLVLATGRVP